MVVVNLQVRRGRGGENHRPTKGTICVADEVCLYVNTERLRLTSNNLRQEEEALTIVCGTFGLNMAVRGDSLVFSGFALCGGASCAQQKFLTLLDVRNSSFDLVGVSFRCF